MFMDVWYKKYRIFFWTLMFIKKNLLFCLSCCVFLAEEFLSLGCSFLYFVSAAFVTSWFEQRGGYEASCWSNYQRIWTIEHFGMDDCFRNFFDMIDICKVLSAYSVMLQVAASYCFLIFEAGLWVNYQGLISVWTTDIWQVPMSKVWYVHIPAVTQCKTTVQYLCHICVKHLSKWP